MGIAHRMSVVLRGLRTLTRSVPARTAAITLAGVAWLIHGAGTGAAPDAGPSPPQAPACRIVATNYVTRSTGAGFTSDMTSACRFDPAALEFACTHQYTDSAGTSSVTKTVTTYRSIDDLVGEIAVVPPLRKSLRSDSVQEGAGGASRSSLVNEYDDRGRLRREVAPAYTTTYTAWDADGRPTAGSTRLATGTQSVRIQYEGLAMTTTTTFGRSSPVTCTQMFDANGNPRSTSCTGPVGARNGSDTTIIATSRICR